MNGIRASGLFLITLAVASQRPVEVRGDTVYLKNGAFINGVTVARGDMLIVRIGEVGKMDIPLEEVHSIEKNGLTGSESHVQVEAREVEEVGRDKRAAAGDEEPEGPDDSVSTDATSDGEAASEDGETAADRDEPAVDRDEAPESSIDPELEERIRSLVKDLERQKAKFRVRAERHLKAIGAPAIPYLLPLVESESELTRVAAMRLFHDFGDDTVIDACVGALLDPNEYVRDFANRTLERVTLEDFGFRPFASPRRREFSHQKWSKWWENEKKELKAARDLAGKK